MTKKQPKISIIIDTREQRPLDFAPFDFVEVSTATLKAGDYSAAGVENSLAIERKSLEDLIGTLNYDYEPDTRKPPKRFNRELLRMMRYRPSRAVVVDAMLSDIMDGSFRSETNPASVMGRVYQIQEAYQIPVMFAAQRSRRSFETGSSIYAREAAWRMAEREAREWSARIVVGMIRACLSARSKFFASL